MGTGLCESLVGRNMPHGALFASHYAHQIIAKSAMRFSTSSSRSLWPIVCLVTSCGVASAAEFSLDLGHTSIYFAVNHYDISLVRGRFTNISGNVAFDVEVKNGVIAISVDADSIDTGNKVLDNVLRSAQFLDTEQYPAIHFVSDRFVFGVTRWSRSMAR